MEVHVALLCSDSLRDMLILLYTCTVNVLLFVDASGRGLPKKVIGSWFCKFVVSNLSLYNSMQILYFVEHQISWF